MATKKIPATSAKATVRTKKPAPKGGGKPKSGGKTIEVGGKTYTLAQLIENQFNELCLCINLDDLSQAEYDALMTFAEQWRRHLRATMVGTRP
jgi:hypothetical protein